MARGYTQVTMNENGFNEFESESLTVTISGLANAIASGNAADLVFEDARDAAAHSAIRVVTACVVVAS